MLKQPWRMFLAAAGIAAVIGLMSGGGVRWKPNQTGPAGIDRMSGTDSKQRATNLTGNKTENSDPRESSRHAAGEVERNRLEQERLKSEMKVQLQVQLGSLLKYDDAQLAVYAAGLELPDNPVREIHPKYLEAKRKYEELKLAGLGEVHPTVKAQKETLDGLKRELDEGVIKLRESLTARLKLPEASQPTAPD